MAVLTKRERILNAINGGEVDRIPIGLWLHHPDRDQDPRALAETQVAFAKKYDIDFIKLTPFGLYSVQDWGCKVKFKCTRNDVAEVEDHGIKDINDWNRLEVFPGHYGTWGKQVQLAVQVKKLLKGDDIPFIQTIFSPLTTAWKLAGSRLFIDLRENPEEIHNALRAITETTINFIRANIDAGVSGFFFATQCATTDLLTAEEYEEFGAKYDLQLFEEYKDKTFFNVIHIHGENVMFERLAKYPGNCINWHDRTTGPSLSEARGITDKCLLGGISENTVFLKGSPDEVQRHIREAVELGGTKKLIIGPGCVADPRTSAENYFAARLALEHNIKSVSNF
jgi:uroporphyrinogen decarboxylase